MELYTNSLRYRVCNTQTNSRLIQTSYPITLSSYQNFRLYCYGSICLLNCAFLSGYFGYIAFRHI